MPSVVIIFSLFFTVALFSIRDITFHFSAAVLNGVLLCFLLPFRKLKSGIFPISLLLLFTFSGNLFFNAGKIIYSNGFMSITDEGLYSAGVRTLRVFSMIATAKVLTALIPLDKIMYALERVLRPFETFGLPVKEFFSIMGLTLKAFPALMTHLIEGYRKEKDELREKGFQNNIFRMGAFLFPVFVRSIRTPEVFFQNLGHVQRPGHSD